MKVFMLIVEMVAVSLLTAIGVYEILLDKPLQAAVVVGMAILSLLLVILQIGSIVMEELLAALGDRGSSEDRRRLDSEAKSSKIRGRIGGGG